MIQRRALGSYRAPGLAKLATRLGTSLALRAPEGTFMAPIVGLLGCACIAWGLWGSAVRLNRDKPRF